MDVVMPGKYTILCFTLTGHAGLPIDTCAECYWEALKKFASENLNPFLKEISLVVEDFTMATEIGKAMEKAEKK